MGLPQLQIYAKICKRYAKYVSMKVICIICTSHFADEEKMCLLAQKGEPSPKFLHLEINGEFIWL